MRTISPPIPVLAFIGEARQRPAAKHLRDLVEAIKAQGVERAGNESLFRVGERTSIERNNRGALCEALAIAQVAMKVAAHFALGERHQARSGDSCRLEDALIDRFVVKEPFTGYREQVIAFGANVSVRNLLGIFVLKGCKRVLHCCFSKEKAARRRLICRCIPGIEPGKVVMVLW